MRRYSSRRERLDQQFLIKKLDNAVSYDRIAGYFCSSILEVAGESIEKVEGRVRVICNSNLKAEDIEVAQKAHKMKQEWTAFSPEHKYTSEESRVRLKRLYDLIVNDKLEIRVIPDEVYGLMHGKAGVITYKDGTKTSFLGSINETKSAFTCNYEMVWEDNSEESVKWVQEEFDFFWNNQYAVRLSDFVVNDLNRIANREVIDLELWRENADEIIPAVAVEEPVYRKEFGLWEHQKYFVELAFKEHKKQGGARFVLADQVGLGKTLQLAMAAKLMVLYGNKPVLIIVPKTLVWQWQGEMWALLNMPSAVWTGNGWQDEMGHFYQGDGARSILKCPRKVGIVSQGLLSRRTEAAEMLLQKEFECVILDEAHRARRKNPTKDPNTHKAEPNNLLQFLNEISLKTKSLLLATATPVQLHPIEAYDLLFALCQPTDKVLGNSFSYWRTRSQYMLDIICDKELLPMESYKMWDIVKNPFPSKNPMATDEISRFRDNLGINDNEHILIRTFESLSIPNQNKIKEMYFSGKFIKNHNPYIRHIVRRTRAALENKINPVTGDTYLKKINVDLYGENDEDAIELEGPLKQAYRLAEEFCFSLATRVKSAGFISTLMLKRIGSTIAAGENTAKKMLAWTTEGREILEEILGDDEDFDEEISNTDDVSEIKNLTTEELDYLEALVKQLTNSQDTDPKYSKLLNILNNGVSDNYEPWKNGGCIVFSQYYDSAYFVARKLSIDMLGEVVGLYAGGDKSGYFVNGQFYKETKDSIKLKVRDGEIKLLVGTDAASEGLNLQTLSTLINLDLPWNPTRLEQRKGRIQRIGQLASTIKIYNMRYKDSVEDRVHAVLSERLKNIKDMFGQIPDTLESVWIHVAKNEIEEAKLRINNLPSQNPFVIKYETQMAKASSNWEETTFVLDNEEKLKQLLMGW